MNHMNLNLLLNVHVALHLFTVPSLPFSHYLLKRHLVILIWRLKSFLLVQKHLTKVVRRTKNDNKHHTDCETQ